MTRILEAVLILLFIWQLMSRFRRNYQISPNAKSEFKEAIEDAKNRLHSTGVFKILKKGEAINDNFDKEEIQIEQTIVPAKNKAKEDLAN